MHASECLLSNGLFIHSVPCISFIIGPTSLGYVRTTSGKSSAVILLVGLI